ncbi:MAG TPA: hypothetical protein PKE21_10930 [Flavobacteriales bacterium]|nr:hypothetical protein [Flavobacteriales bacterium]HMR27982.1 hypothetical protein [Flavobacteriales bacterium]
MRGPSLLVIGLIAGPTFGQNIGINASGAVPDASALLDLDVTAHPANDKKGLLVPRIALTATNVAAPVVAPALSLLVFNTATAGVAPNNVTPGYYYWSGAAWTRLFVGTDAWTLVGNTIAGTERMGSINAQPVRFISSNLERMRIHANGQITVNSAVAQAGDVFAGFAGANNFAVNGYSTAAGGTGTYGFAQNNNSFGMWAENIVGTGTGIVANGQAVGGLILVNGSGGAFTGGGVGLFSAGTTVASGTGVLGVGNNVAGGTLLAGSGLAGSGLNFGVYGVATSNATGTALAPVRAGGYFVSGTGGTQVLAYVASYDGVGSPRKIVGTGTVNTVVENGAGELVLLSAPEAPENLFQDHGTGSLVNGHAHITLDPTFTRNIEVNEKHPLRVFVQLRGDCRGVYVSNETATGFEVTELQGGTSNAPFFWTVVANRANVHHADGTIWPYAEERFAKAHGAQPVAPQMTVAAGHHQERTIPGSVPIARP